MAYNCFNDLPDDLANLDLSDSKELYTEEISQLIGSKGVDSLLSDYAEGFLYSDPYNNYSMSDAGASTSNLLDPYDSQHYNSRSNSHSPYHEISYSDTSLYPEDYSSSSSSSPYGMSEDTYNSGISSVDDSYNSGLPSVEVSSHIYSGYGTAPSGGLLDAAVGGYNPVSPQPGAKPKQKRDRKTKEFYASLTPEEKKQREKEKCKLRVQRFREREREKNGNMAKQLQSEEDRKKMLSKQLKELQKLKQQLNPEQFKRLMEQLKQKRS